MAEEAKQETLVFESEAARMNALSELPDDPPPGANVDVWLKEQEDKEREIMDAPLKESSENAASEEQPPVQSEEPPVQEEAPRQVENQPSEPVVEVEEDEYVDFSALGKVKKSDLPEDLRNYPSPQEMLKQAAHARRYANSAESKLRDYESQLADMQSKLQSVPEMQKKLADLQKAADAAQKAVDSKPSISSGQRAELSDQLRAINDSINTLSGLDPEETEKFQGVLKDTVGAFSSTLSELDSVREEFGKYRKESERRYADLENSIKNVSETTAQAEARRRQEREQKDAERGLEELQRRYPELKTSRPLYSEDRNDVESAILKFAGRVYGRNPQSFDEVNRLVAAYNAKDSGLVNICKQEGISPADYGISNADIRNYGILMNVYWRQRGERIDPATGKRVPVTDWRGQKVTFPDFEATFNNMKDSGGISQLEKEQQIIDAEKRGQSQLEASLNKRDTSPPTLGPTGAPAEGQTMSKEQALEIIGEKEGRTTIDEERMELLLRKGDKRGWDMWSTWTRAHEALEIPVPSPEAHWKKPAQ